MVDDPRIAAVRRGNAGHGGAGPARAAVTHGDAALAFYTGGRARVELNGEWDVGAGDLLLVPAGTPHRTLATENTEVWSLSFAVPSFVGGGDGALLDPLERVRDHACPVVAIPPERHGYLDTLFRELERAHVHEAVPRSLLVLVLAEVARAASPVEVPRGVAGEALRFIERHCLGKLTLEDVAAAVKRSPAYVTTALTRATGRSAVQWIVRCRMAEARRLLLGSDERIDIVAERIGYADATHFIRMFRREHGVTPAAWRARKRH